MIVLHKHHVGSIGWRHEILTEATRREAFAYALVRADEWKGRDIAKVSGHAIELPDLVQVQAAQRGRGE